MEIFIIIYICVIGLLIGSFLNVCIYRIPKEESVANPPSHCYNCGTRLRPLDLVPVLSFLFIRGKCRYCGSKISPRYAGVELLTAICYLVLYFKYHLTVDFIASVFLMTILIVVFFIDLDHKIIPDGLVIIGLVGGICLVIYNIFYPIHIMGDRAWWNPLLGLVIGSGALMLVGFIGSILYKTEDAMGGGDIKIFAPIGIFLGWKMTIIALLASVFIAGFIGLFLILLGAKNRKSTIPFGPFIVTGTFVAFMWGWDIVNWYIGRLQP